MNFYLESDDGIRGTILFSIILFVGAWLGWEDGK